MTDKRLHPKRRTGGGRRPWPKLRSLAVAALASAGLWAALILAVRALV